MSEFEQGFREMLNYFFAVMTPAAILIATPDSVYARVYYWFCDFPAVSRVRKRLIAQPPLFGERGRRLRLPDNQFAPDFVAPPTWDNCHKPVQLILRILWVLFVLIPYSFYQFFKNIRSLCRKVTVIAEIIMRTPEDDLEKTTTYAKTGKKMSAAGKKGAQSKASLSVTTKRDDSIREHARILLDNGKDFDSLAGILRKRFAPLEGYPSSDRQYRNILKPLREELEKKRKSNC